MGIRKCDYCEQDNIVHGVIMVLIGEPELSNFCSISCCKLWIEDSLKDVNGRRIKE